MNRGEIRTLVRTYLNEPTAAFWTDAELNTAIGVASIKCHNMIKNLTRYHFTTRVTFPLVAGDDWYQLPGDCKDIKLVTKIMSSNDDEEVPLYRAPSDNPFPFSDVVSSVQNSSDEGPQTYWIIGGSMRFLPMPSSAMTIRIYYEARITAMTSDANTPNFDTDYHDMAAKWAAIEAAVKDGQKRDDLVALFAIREKDMYTDIFHRLPAPPSEVEGYMQGIY